MVRFDLTLIGSLFHPTACSIGKTIHGYMAFLGGLKKQIVQLHVSSLLDLIRDDK